ncbi:MAG: hypothetical protein JXR97_00840 [Planctomycetes bacterium]|nr:hypothetical protein [Planctomycetota bacterium]
MPNIFILLAIFGFIGLLVELFLRKKNIGTENTAAKVISKEESERRDKAIETLQERLESLRNKTKSLEEEVDKDPKRVARTLGKVMKNK